MVAMVFRWLPRRLRWAPSLIQVLRLRAFAPWTSPRQMRADRIGLASWCTVPSKYFLLFDSVLATSGDPPISLHLTSPIFIILTECLLGSFRSWVFINAAPIGLSVRHFSLCYVVHASLGRSFCVSQTFFERGLSCLAQGAFLSR